MHRRTVLAFLALCLAAVTALAGAPAASALTASTAALSVNTSRVYQKHDVVPFTITLRPGVKRAVQIQEYRSGSWVKVYSAYTSTTGVLKQNLGAMSTTPGVKSLRAVAPKTTRYGTAVSKVVKVTRVNASTVTVGAYAKGMPSVPGNGTVKASPTEVMKGGPLLVMGVVSPRVTGRPVTLQRYSGGRWVTAATKTTTNGEYTFGVGTGTAGTFAYRVTTPTYRYRYKAASKTVWVAVKTVRTAVAYDMAADYAAGDLAVATFAGKVSPAWSGRVVILDRKRTDGTWAEHSRTVTGGTGAFTLKAQAVSILSGTFRIRVPATTTETSWTSMPLWVSIS